MKLQVSKRTIENEKKALKRAKKSGYSSSQAKTLLRRFYKSGGEDANKLDDWIRKEELKRGNRRISTKKEKKKKEFDDYELEEKEKELADRVLEGWSYGADLEEFGEIELKATARQLGLKPRGRVTKKSLVRMIDAALCKPPECQREEPEWLKNVGIENNKTKRKMKKKKKKNKDKNAIKGAKTSVVGIVSKKKKVAIAEILPFNMPKLF